MFAQLGLGDYDDPHYGSDSAATVTRLTAEEGLRAAPYPAKSA